MTAHSRTLSYEPPAAASADKPIVTEERQPLTSPLAPGADDRKWFIITILGMLVMYGLLQNPYWVPGGDSEFYTSIARDMALGMGYQFNGEPVAMVPPGWPAVMALVMKVTPYFLPLKLLTMGCMIGGLAIGYWIARRFVPPKTAALVILTTAIVSYMFQCTFWLMSEGLFCLVSATALLLAFHINEGRPGAWRVALLVLLCVAAVFVRWAGALGVLLIGAALLHGELRPRVNRLWIAAVLVAVVTTSTLFILRKAQEVTPEQALAAAEFGGAGEITDDPVVATADQQTAKSYDLVTGSRGGGGYKGRLLGWGRWFSFFYWQPFRAAAGSWGLNLAANLTGWIVIALLCVVAFVMARRRRWLWLAILPYTGALALNWPNPNSRYLVPIAFLVTLAVVLAAEQLAAWSTTRLGKSLARGALYTFIGAVALCNVALWAVEVSVAHADDFYARYETGLNQNLIAAARYFNERGDVGDGQIAVSGKYRNMGKQRHSWYGLRATSLLTGKSIVSVPNRYITRDGKPTITLNRWLYNRRVKYYLAQPPVSPWRVWHFRVPWWQEYRTGLPVEPIDSDWQLYRVDGPDVTRRVHLQPSRDWPTRVPGL
jgi:hypothetical protein